MEIQEAIVNRRTIRKFGQRPLTEEQVMKYIDAARLAACGANKQALKYVAVTEAGMVACIFDKVKWAAYIAPEGNPAEGERPTAFVAVLADLDIKKSGYEMDVGAAVTNMMLSAWGDGVGCCWMGAIDYDGISALLELPERLRLTCVVAMGDIGEHPVAEEIQDGDVKYYKDGTGTLHVPKRKLSEIVMKTYI